MGEDLSQRGLAQPPQRLPRRQANWV